MRVRGRRRKSIAFFITLGACLVALAIALNVGWILLNWREVALLVLGIVFFLAIIFGLVLNTTFDSFVPSNAQDTRGLSGATRRVLRHHVGG